MHALVLVLLLGLMVNGHNSGGVQSLKELKKDIVSTVPVADYSKLND